MDISSNDPRSRNTASTSRRKNRIREGANLREIIDTGQISPEQQPRTLRELIEREIPEDLRELCTVAYYASSPLTYIRHFHFPQRLWYRVFVILETIAWPTRSIIAVFCLIADWTCRAFGYELFSGKPSESELPLLVWKVADSSVRGICFWGTGWPGLSEWGLRERFLRIFTMGKLTRTSVQNGVSSVEQGHLENSTSLPSLPTSRNGRRSFDHQTNGDASCNGLLTTGKSRDPSKIDVKPVAPADTEENKPPSCDRLIGSPKQNLYKQKYSRVDADSPEPASSRDSSVGDDRNKSSDEPDRSGSAEAESSALKSARKLRRKQIQQTKREAEKAAKLARNYNKTQRRAEERKMIEAKTEEILAKDGNGKKAVVDSEPDVERERNLAAKRKAKLAVEKPIIRAVKPKAPETKLTSGSMPSTPGFHKTESSGPKFDFPCAQTRLAAHYPPQCDVIQQAFFRVEPKENGLMFTEMNRDQCLQLVKQLKRDNQNLFLLDPKVSVDLLLRSTRTSSYRIDGEYVSLARKSSVAAYANAGNRSSQEKRDSSSNWNKNYANPRGSERRTSPPNPWRNGNDVPSSTNFPRKSTSEEPFNPDHCWSGSLSPNESENGSLDFVRDREIRMSPLLMSYAGAAGNQSLSQKSSGDFAGQGNNAWRATPSPASVSLDTTAKEVLAGSRFAWEPKKSSDGDSVALKEKPDTSKSSMDKKLADYDDQLEETFGKQKGMFLGCNEQDFYGFVSKSGVEEEPRPRRNRGSIFDFSNDPEVSWPEEPFNDATFSASLWDTDSIWKSPSFTKASWTSHPSDTAMSSPWTSDTVNDSMTSMTYTAPKESGVSFWQDSIWSTSSFFQSAEVSDPKCPAGTDFQEAQKSLVPSKYTFGIIGAEIQEAKPATDERYCTK